MAKAPGASCCDAGFLQMPGRFGEVHIDGFQSNIFNSNKCPTMMRRPDWRHAGDLGMLRPRTGPQEDYRRRQEAHQLRLFGTAATSKLNKRIVQAPMTPVGRLRRIALPSALGAQKLRADLAAWALAERTSRPRSTNGSVKLKGGRSQLSCPLSISASVLKDFCRAGD